MLRKLWNWIDERSGIGPQVNYILFRRLPKGIGWAQTLGSATMVLILLQIITGALLTLYYAPTPDHAYDSVNYIMNEVSYGWLIRGIHKWSASVLVVIIFAHMVRVFIFGSHKKPRELTWMIGVALLILVLALGFTGYLLPWDQKAYWATVVGTRIMETTPLVGNFLMRLARGGEDVGALTLTRFFSLHTIWLPALLVFLMLIHVALVIKQGIAQPPWVKGSGKDGKPFYPDTVAKDAVTALIVFAVVVALAVARRVEMEPPADPASVGYVPRPEWYFLWLFRMLWLFPGSIEWVGAVLVPTAIVVLLFLAPFIEWRPERHPLRRPVATGVMLAGVGFVAVFTYLGATAPTPSMGGSAVASAQAEPGLTESQLQGKQLYLDLGCAACHAIKGVGSAVGPDLTNIGAKRDPNWLMDFMKDPKKFYPSGMMPAYDLPAEDEKKLIEYLSTLKG